MPTNDRQRPVARFVPQLAADQLTGPRGRYFGPLFDPDLPAQGGGGPGGDPEAAFQRGLERANNDGIAWARELYRDNERYRATNRQLRERQIPEGGIALTGEQAQSYQAYQALGAPADLTNQIAELATLRAESARTKRREQITEVAGLVGYDPDVLAQLGSDLEYEIRTVTGQGGAAIRQALVKDGDIFRPLEELAPQRWEKFMPALKPQSGAGAQGGSPAGQGPRFPQQGAGSKAPASDPVGKRIEDQQAKRAEQKNPLQRR